MHIRAFRKKDEGQIKELILSILTKEYPFDRSAYSESDLDSISSSYGGSRDAFFVIEAEGAVFGTVGVKEDSEETALLRRLFIDPRYRRHGYGTVLMGKAIEHCKGKNFKRLIFRTTGRMVQAIALCKKNDFREAEKIDLGGFQIYTFVREL